jgi:septal ring factor EnvC (AmiA/AmiB activator)
MFNPKMFKQKKKRAVDPNAPPRPNLLSQDKKLREQQSTVEQLQNRVQEQSGLITSLENKIRYMASVLENLHSKINDRK